nr:MAG TPA: hypothetical protein [Caudoviricetes sp.]
MKLKRTKLPENYDVIDVFAAQCQGQDNEDLSPECNDAFQELESYFVNTVCGGSEQFAWALINAIDHRARNGKPHDIESLIRLGSRAQHSEDDVPYINYIGVILSIYESINTDVLVANYQYIIPRETVDEILNNYDELTTTHSVTMYNNAKEVFSRYINTEVIPADEAVTLLYNYYESNNNLDLDDEYYIRQAIADEDYNKLLVYFIKVCRDDAMDKIAYADTVKFEGI